ncbi:hypothetical protein AVEN_175830-1 [Araneus ventricosus]|nr:hypothetical protein AVEN_175830-1 [Araneus ventricosus]
MSGFGLTKGEDVKILRKKKHNLETQRGEIPTASTLLASTKATENKVETQLNGNLTFNFGVLDQAVICENVLPVNEGSSLDELKDLGVILTDTNVSSESIQVLIGADIMSRLLTDKRKLSSSGLVAVETHLEWTLMGKVPQVNTERVNLAVTVTLLFMKEAGISDLWKLDVIGIKDPMEKMSKHEIDLKTKEHFKEAVKFNQNNRYEVCLPWAWIVLH